MLLDGGTGVLSTSGNRAQTAAQISSSRARRHCASSTTERAGCIGLRRAHALLEIAKQRRVKKGSNIVLSYGSEKAKF